MILTYVYLPVDVVVLLPVTVIVEVVRVEVVDEV